MRSQSMFSSSMRFAAAALVALSVAACEHNPAEPGVLASITVTPNPQTLAVGAAQQFVAVGKDANGTVVGLQPVWTMAASGGTINGSGVVTAGNVLGTFVNTVTASYGSISGKATINVISGIPATVTVTPTPVTLAIGATQQFTAVFKDAGGNVVTGNPTWAVLFGGGTIAQTGLFTAGTTAGTFTNTVVASMGTISGTATVTVTPGALVTIQVTPNPATMLAAGTQQFTATGRDVNGNAIPTTVFWSLQAGGGALSATGLFTAGAVSGTFVNTIRACVTAACVAGDIAGFATVIITPGAITSITVTPNPVNVGTRASQAFVAVGKDANGNVVPILPPVTWSVLPGYAGGTILSGGGYIAPNAVGIGFDTVRATSGALSGSARVNVQASASLVSIAVTPNPANTTTGGVVTFTATGFDGTGLVVPTPGLVWSVVAGGGSIDQAGNFTAGASAGLFANTVKASSSGQNGFASVNVGVPAAVSFLGTTVSLAGILGGVGVTCGSGAINADVMVHPGVAWTQGLCTFTGATHLGDPVALTAQSELNTALVTLLTKPCDVTYGAGADLGTISAVLPLAPGVYCSPTTFLPTGIVKLAGPANGVWIFAAGSSLTAAVGSSVVITGGGLAKNVYWANGASASIGNAAAWQGNILASSSISLGNGVTLLGRALAHTGSVTMGTLSTITLP